MIPTVTFETAEGLFSTFSSIDQFMTYPDTFCEHRVGGLGGCQDQNEVTTGLIGGAVFLWFDPFHPHYTVWWKLIYFFKLTKIRVVSWPERERDETKEDAVGLRFD